MKTIHSLLLVATVFSIGLHKPIHAGEMEDQHFAVHVLPLLKTKCFACHGADPDDIKGKYILVNRTELISGGASEQPSVIVGHPESSPLIEAIKWDGLEMPPKESDRLTASEIKQLEKWVRDGAVWPNEETIARYQKQWAQQATQGIIVTTSGGLDAGWDNRRYNLDDLWAYQQLREQLLPKDIPENLHPIDYFIERTTVKHSLPLAQPASRTVLVRRIYFDLTGLPPSVAQAKIYLRNRNPQATQMLITELLESPRYAEQQAQHWLDVTRYADTSGFSRDDPRPNAWRYRDYVIRSFAQDKPFNQFIREQIAGDEIDPSNPEMHVASGFLRMGPYEHTGMSVEAITRQQYLDDTTNAIGETFLGLVLRCAKCHDHKFDPIPTRDYYRMQAILTPTFPANRKTPFLPQENTDGFSAATERIEKLIAVNHEQKQAIQQRADNAAMAFLVDRGHTVSQESLQQFIRTLPGDQKPPRHLGLSHTDLGLLKVLKKSNEYYQRMLLTYIPQSLAVYSGKSNHFQSNLQFNSVGAQTNVKPPQSYILTGGAIDAPSVEVTPGIISAVGLTVKGQNTQITQTVAQRRLALADWIASEHNTFTARVIVNRIWQSHFANRGIVATANNFGASGSRPSHPQLLDHLAKWFIDHDWSIKQLHAYIMSSNTYQRSSIPVQSKVLATADPDNVLLSYFPPRRLTAEELRDSMLFVSSELDMTMGGPGVYPDINREVALQPIHVMGSVAPAWQPSLTPALRNRRSLYVYRQRGRAYPLLEVFNQPETTTSCEGRDETTVTPQAFTLLNSVNSYARSLAMANSLTHEAKTVKQQITLAFERTYGRKPTTSQQQIVMTHYRKMLNHHQQHIPQKVTRLAKVNRTMIEEMTGEDFSWFELLDVFSHPDYQADLQPSDVTANVRALAEVCLILFNSNEFIYIY